MKTSKLSILSLFLSFALGCQGPKTVSNIDQGISYPCSAATGALQKAGYIPEDKHYTLYSGAVVRIYNDSTAELHWDITTNTNSVIDGPEANMQQMPPISGLNNQPLSSQDLTGILQIFKKNGCPVPD